MADHRPHRPDGGVTFPHVIASEFAFLADRGFRSTIESGDAVPYEDGNGVFVRVLRDRRDGYVGFRVGLTRRPKDSLTMTELSRFTGADSRGEYPEGPAELRASAARLAQLLRTHGTRVLRGDEAILAEAMALRSEYTKAFTRPQPPPEASARKQ